MQPDERGHRPEAGAGVDVQTIKNYFVAQYGPQVLGEPPMEGFNWLAWVLPVVALIVGGGVCLLAYPQDGAYGADGCRQHSGSGVRYCAGSDEYTQKLDEELKHYD